MKEEEEECKKPILVATLLAIPSVRSCSLLIIHIPSSETIVTWIDSDKEVGRVFRTP